MLIYSDPHIGKNLVSNTTQDSRKRFQKFILQNTCELIGAAGDREKVCAGDFFDTYQNPEEVLHDSFWPANETNYILAGNHDVVNIKGRKGSLDIIDTVFSNKVVPCHYGKPYFRSLCFPTKRQRSLYPTLYMVPHHSSQDLFELALDAAMQQAEKDDDNAILVLHCNYNSDFARDETSLNLSQRKAKYLLSVFDLIFIGHEHNHRTDLYDRVIVVGSPHPTSFADISDKFVIHFNDRIPTLVPTWSASRHYLEVPHDQLLDRVRPDHQFIRITGSILPSELHELTKSIRAVWQQHSPFAIRSDVVVATGSQEETRFTGMSPERLHAIICQELKGSPDLLALWKEVTTNDKAAGGKELQEA